MGPIFPRYLYRIRTVENSLFYMHIFLLFLFLFTFPFYLFLLLPVTTNVIMLLTPKFPELMYFQLHYTQTLLFKRKYIYLSPNCLLHYDSSESSRQYVSFFVVHHYRTNGQVKLKISGNISSLSTATQIDLLRVMSYLQFTLQATPFDEGHG